MGFLFLFDCRHQERLEFLYDSGLSVGKSANSEGFKALEQLPKSDATDAAGAGSSASASKVCCYYFLNFFLFVLVLD